MNGGIICQNIVKIMKSQLVVIYLNLYLIKLNNYINGKKYGKYYFHNQPYETD